MEKSQLEEYIKDLPPELQEKARAAKTPEELMALARDSRVELDPDVLDMVAGGCGGTGSEMLQCPKCGSYDIMQEKKVVDGIIKIIYNCRFCTARWE